MMIPEKYEIFYPNVYSPEEQAAIDRLLSGDMGGPPGGPGGPADDEGAGLPEGEAERGRNADVRRADHPGKPPVQRP